MTDTKPPTQTPIDPPLKFTQEELTMLGQTADALSAYMGAVVLAELDQHETAQWVVFGRALGTDETPEDDVVHVQMGGPGAQLLGQQGGIDAKKEPLDCALLWAIELTDDPQGRFMRLDTEGEVFDWAKDLKELLPFSLEEPALDDETSEENGKGSDGTDGTTAPLIAPGNDTRH